MLVVSNNLLNSQNDVYYQSMVGYKDTSDVAKKSAEVAQKKRAITGPW